MNSFGNRLILGLVFSILALGYAQVSSIQLRAQDIIETNTVPTNGSIATNITILVDTNSSIIPTPKVDTKIERGLTKTVAKWQAILAIAAIILTFVIKKIPQIPDKHLPTIAFFLGPAMAEVLKLISTFDLPPESSVVAGMIAVWANQFFRQNYTYPKEERRIARETEFLTREQAGKDTGETPI